NRTTSRWRDRADRPCSPLCAAPGPSSQERFMLTRTRVLRGLPMAAVAVLCLPGMASAQIGYPLAYPQQRYDPNAINAMLAAQQSASRSGRGASFGRGHYVGAVTGSGFLAQPLQTVNQFGPNSFGEQFNVNPFSGASGIAAGAAVGVALAAEANLVHEPAGV